jgi:hypothetical protein
MDLTHNTRYLWPGEHWTSRYGKMLHVCDDNGPLCGKLPYSFSGNLHPLTFRGPVTCPICDRLQELPPQPGA